MKRILFILTIASLLFSCQKDEEEIRDLSDQKILVVGSEDVTFLDFGSVLLNATTTIELPISNSNISDSQLNITEITLPNGYSADWTTATLEPGEIRNLQVSFTPTDENEDYTGKIQIISDRTAGVNEISIRGAGTLPEVIISVSGNLDFGTAFIGDFIVSDFVISNTGLVPLTISNIILPNDTDFAVDWTDGIIQPGASQTVNIGYSPSSEGDHSGILQIISDATQGNGTLQVTALAESNIYTDPRDGKTYPLVNINGTVWMQANFAFDEGLGSLDAGGSEGRIYTNAQAQAAVPDGWHIATDEEWTNVELFLGMSPNVAEIICDTREDALVAQQLFSGGGTLELTLSGLGLGGQVFFPGELGGFWTSTDGESVVGVPGFFFIRSFDHSTNVNDIARCVDSDDPNFGSGVSYSIRLVKD